MTFQPSYQLCQSSESEFKVKILLNQAGALVALAAFPYSSGSLKGVLIA